MSSRKIKLIKPFIEPSCLVYIYPRVKEYENTGPTASKIIHVTPKAIVLLFDIRPSTLYLHLCLLCFIIAFSFF